MKQHILLVDDNEHACDIFQRKLEHEGYQVSQCRNGNECLTFLQETIPDLVLLDLMMPGIDGFSVLKISKSRPELKKLPFVVLSARDFPVDRQKALALGAAEYLTKGKNPIVKVVEVVRRILTPISSQNAVVRQTPYRVALQEIGDGAQLQKDLGVANGFRCPACEGPLYLDLVPVTAGHVGPDTFFGRFVCGKCGAVQPTARVPATMQENLMPTRQAPAA